MKSIENTHSKLKDYVKIRDMLSSSWAQKPITSLDILNAYGKQKVDKHTAERLEKSIKNNIHASYDLSKSSKNGESLLPNISSGYYLSNSSIISKYIGGRSDSDGLIMKLNNRGS